jgi:hypothetical protein
MSLSQDEIENMVREAEAHAETDKINRERVEAINQAEVRSALLKGPSHGSSLHYRRRRRYSFSESYLFNFLPDSMRSIQSKATCC